MGINKCIPFINFENPLYFRPNLKLPFYLSKWPQIKNVVSQNVSKIEFYFKIHLRKNSKGKILPSQLSWAWQYHNFLPENFMPIARLQPENPPSPHISECCEHTLSFRAFWTKCCVLIFQLCCTFFVLNLSKMLKI